MAFLLNSQAQGVSGKMNNLLKHHGARPLEARGLMQLHRPWVRMANTVRVAGQLRMKKTCCYKHILNSLSLLNHPIVFS